MHTLSAEVRAKEARVRLKRSRRWATGLLLAAAGLFIASALYLKQYPQLGYVKAFAEAAMVGALADWFAVTALFRHPLGLKIPHTAVLPRNQARIADELGRFIENNFLLGKPIAMRVYQAGPSEKLLDWLGGDGVRKQWLPWLAAQLPVLLRTVPSEKAAAFGSALLERHYGGAQIGRLLSDGLKLLKQNGLHLLLFYALMKQVRQWLQNPDTRGLLENNLRGWAAKIEGDAPGSWDKIKAALKTTLVSRVDDWVAEKALDWADGYLAAALENPEHNLQRHFEQQFDVFTDKLAESPEWHARLAQAKVRIAQSPAVRENLAALWTGVQNWAQNDTAGSGSQTVAQLEKILNYLLAQAAQNPAALRRADLRISLLTRDLVMRYKEQVSLFVSDKVKSWDSKQMVDKLELSVGKDLQFIRINGTIVGGLVGLAIYCVSQWLV